MNKPRNIVAKFANRVNRCSTHRDRKNDYKRAQKHRKQGY